MLVLHIKAQCIYSGQVGVMICLAKEVCASSIITHLSIVCFSRIGCRSVCVVKGYAKCFWIITFTSPSICYWSFQNVFALDISHFHSSNSKSIRAYTYEIYALK